MGITSKQANWNMIHIVTTFCAPAYGHAVVLGYMENGDGSISDVENIRPVYGSRTI